MKLKGMEEQLLGWNVALMLSDGNGMADDYMLGFCGIRAMIRMSAFMASQQLSLPFDGAVY